MPFKSQLVSRFGLICCRSETEGLIKGRAKLSHRPEPNPFEVAPCTIDQKRDEVATDPCPPVGRVDVDMADAAYGRVVEVGIDVETTDGAQGSATSHLGQHFTGPIESIRSIPPLLHKPNNEIVTFPIGRIEKKVDIPRQLGYRTYVCNHDRIV